MRTLRTAVTTAGTTSIFNSTAPIAISDVLPIAGKVRYLEVRNGIDGRPLPVSPGQVAYSVIFCIGSFLIGSMIFKRFEARVVKKI